MPAHARVCVILIVAGAGCTGAPHVFDRQAGPEAAFEQAKYSLHAHEVHGYLDALTDDAVLRVLANSIFLCFGSQDPGVQPPPPQSPGCEVIVSAYGYPLSGVPAVRASEENFRRAVAKVRDPRAMAAALELHHRKVGGGTSFAWNSLDDATLLEVAIDGDRATGRVASPLAPLAVEFARDATGWRLRSRSVIGG
jgi:hypothetical protein